MATLNSTMKLTARALRRQSHDYLRRRGLRTIPRSMTAQSFTMPSMSPTMTEGNIASWKVKEGDSFSAGDVLLEIETDKAQMDVEAQDDGVLAKVIKGDGSKSIKVGTRIAVLAEPGDDLSKLSLPAEDSAPDPSPQHETSPNSSPAAPSSSESLAEGPPTSKPSTTPAYKPVPDSPKKSEPSKPREHQTLLPSVQYLLHEHGLPDSEASKIPASGPHGRLLKGDVLAYLGSISSSYPSDLSARVTKLSHLDLSNIKIATPPPKPDTDPKESSTSPTPSPLEKKDKEPPAEIAISVPISLAAVEEVQDRIHKTLGFLPPLSTFIRRATELANENLPRSRTAPLSPDELFDHVLGLDKVSRLKNTTARGRFMPQITALPDSLAARPGGARPKVKEADIYDILAGRSAHGGKKKRPERHLEAVRGGDLGAGSVPPLTNMFSVSVPTGEEKRAKTFLERVKTVLEVEPERLVFL